MLEQIILKSSDTLFLHSTFREILLIVPVELLGLVYLQSKFKLHMIVWA